MTRPALQRLRFQLLGTPTWQTDDGRGELQGKFAPLVAYVALQRRARDAVARWLWPGDLERAVNSLRTHVKRLRQATEHVVFVQGDVISLAADVSCDLLTPPADWNVSALMTAGDLLAGIEIRDHPAVNGWIRQHRQQWSQSIARTLSTRAETREAANDLSDALQMVTRATQIAPDLEAAWRTKVRLHFLDGDRAAAVRAYDQLHERLAISGVAPSPETLAVWSLVQRDTRQPAPPPAQSASLKRPPVLIGRDVQWAAMTDTLDIGRCFLLVGDGGIGKTRLLIDFLRERGAAVVVRARTGEQAAPYATLGSLLRTLIDRQALELDAAVRHEISVVLTELGRPRDAAPVAEIALWRAVERVLEQAAESGVRSIALDDLHHADIASMRAMRWLAEGGVRQVIHFAFATRPLHDGPLRDFIADWCRDSQPLQVIALAPWSRDDLGGLLATLELAGAAGRISADELHGHAGGNPFLVLETLREAVRRPATATTTLLPTPAVATLLLEERIRSVTAAARPLLQLGAVLDGDMVVAMKALNPSRSSLHEMMRALELHGVLSDGRFVHELMREATLASLTAAERLHWHAVAAGALMADARVPRARVAAHWEAGDRWREAAAAYRAAGLDARDAGLLPESRALLEQAARCYRRAGDLDAEFDALHDSFDGVMDLLGFQEGGKLAGRLGTLASTDEQRARVAILLATVSIAQHVSGPAAAVPAERAEAQARPFDHLHGDALAVLTLGCTQAGRFEDAIDAGRRARALFEAAGANRKAREVTAHLVYVYFEAGRVGDGIELGHRVVAEYEAAGDRSGAATMGGNLAQLILRSGDPAAALAPAERAHQLHLKVEASAISPHAMVNRAVLSGAYAYSGRFGEALEVLGSAASWSADRLPIAMCARGRLSAAHVWLILGADEPALEALGPDEAGWSPKMQVERCWALAQVAAMRRGDPAQHLKRIGEIQAAQWHGPLSQAPWFEWSRQGDPLIVAEHLRALQPLYLQAGMAGAARTAMLRRIHRLREVDSAEAIETAASLARELRPMMDAGLTATIYLPEAWYVLAAALARDGDSSAAADCKDEGRRWIFKVALPHVSSDCRDSFLYRNPVNQKLLAEA